MRIGFDAKRLFNNFTGIGNYSRTLLLDLTTYFPDHEYFLFTPSIQTNAHTQPFINNPFYQLITPHSRLKNWWRTAGIKKDLVANKIEIYHGLSHEIPINIQQLNIPTVVTIHDLIFKKFPNHYSPIDRSIYNVKFRYACKNCDTVIAISENTKKDIVEYYKIDPEKIKVIYQTCAAQYKIQLQVGGLSRIIEKYKLPKDYLLYVGTVSRRKDLGSIVKSISLLPDDFQIPLVVVGKGKTYLKEIQDYIKKNKLGKKIIFLDPENADLPAIFQQANVFLYPSHYEGFGIPILEALNSKTPVITTNVSALPEAAGPGAHYVEPNAPEQIADGIQKILSDKDYSNKLIEEGFLYVQKFDSKNATEKVMKVYESILKERIEA